MSGGLFNEHAANNIPVNPKKPTHAMRPRISIVTCAYGLWLALTFGVATRLLQMTAPVLDT
jgi:hypothetical protein